MFTAKVKGARKIEFRHKIRIPFFFSGPERLGVSTVTFRLVGTR
jgi:hypothetical protein